MVATARVDWPSLHWAPSVAASSSARWFFLAYAAIGIQEIYIHTYRVKTSYQNEIRPAEIAKGEYQLLTFQNRLSQRWSINMLDELQVRQILIISYPCINTLRIGGWSTPCSRLPIRVQRGADCHHIQCLRCCQAAGRVLQFPHPVTCPQCCSGIIYLPNCNHKKVISFRVDTCKINSARDRMPITKDEKVQFKPVHHNHNSLMIPHEYERPSKEWLTWRLI